jgi:LemA protein
MVSISGILIFLLAAVVGIVCFVIWPSYNRLVTLRSRYRNAYSQIDVQLQRRYDLIPNLVETAKGYMAHERQTLEAVIAARNEAMGAARGAAADPGNPQAMQRSAAAEGELTGMLSRLMVLSEAYPDLKANQQMAMVMEELSTTENKVSFARQAFNDEVTLYNTKREVFPSNIIANTFNFSAAELWADMSAGARQAPRVSFSS